ncbi:uncharacterized protein ACA1_280580 [Acanthamoeba castellanii str. Neff]|uniref:Uncharacterized protein n=1 Tax=Acanthamoeba castellanii (strain ATCC 30010 / Neff) TaxID=1257118 RepID=L8H667_ACACF|nr:uncharacterized protein ACA1_280580 [Acanthamoeba castellanii str. Neff]ELR21004.1 hypothetical protein ACA1_280580 [Acanthamoeba castellanii str. Neff]
MAALKEIEECHLQALENGEDSYLDPRTGYSVFTSCYLLSRRKCCASKCRHCPYKHEKVKAHECTPETCPFQVGPFSNALPSPAPPSTAGS